MIFFLAGRIVTKAHRIKILTFPKLGMLSKEIFEGKVTCFKKLSDTAKNLWADSLVTRGMKNLINERLKVDERAWLADILQNFSPKRNANLKPGLPCW